MLMKSFDTVADRTIIFVGGEIDVAEAPTLYDEASRAVTVGRREVIVDLYNVTRLDTAAVVPLLRAGQLARRNGGSFSVECARGQPARAGNRAARRNPAGPLPETPPARRCRHRCRHHRSP